jgi:hypothetical protein
MRRITNLVGQKFEHLTVIEYCDHGVWKCRCDCGSMTHALTGDLNRGNHKSCGCYRKAFMRAKISLRPYEALYNRLRVTAARNARGFELGYDEFVKFTEVKKCHYCEAVINWAEYSDKTNQGYNLDRKDAKLGYTIDNCVPCCKRCNFGKGKGFTYDEWVQIGNVIKAWKK